MIMGLKIICLTVIVLGMVTTASTATACSRTTFGNNCEYQCHCAGRLACGTDGSCHGRCASGWEGEYCQRGNAAAGKSSEQSWTDGPYSSSLALDGNTSQAFSSCSHTTNQDQPWWQVDLGKEYVLFTVKIWNSIEGEVRDVVEGRECKTTQNGAEYRGTMNTTRRNFTCADWFHDKRWSHYYRPKLYSYNYCRNPSDRNPYRKNHEVEPWCYTTETEEKNRWDYCDVPWCQSKLNNFKIWIDNNLCYHYKGTVGFGQTVDIRCDTPVVGRYLKIQLLDSSTVLTLCEVTIRASQYRACSNNYYGPDCNNRCQCANDVTCDDKTGLCPSGDCNDRFTGLYCNIGILSVSKNGASTPTSISVKWQYIIHDSAYDAGKVEKFYLGYQEYMSPSSSSRGLVSYAYSSPSPGMMSANITNLKPSTRYRFHIRLTYESLKTGSVPPVQGPTENFQTESCTGNMVIPVITVTNNAIYTRLTWPNRAYLEIKAEVAGMMAGCKKELDVYAKKTNESNYVKITNRAGQKYTVYRLSAFTEYDIKASVRSPDGYQKDNIQKTRTAEDVPSAPSIANAGATPTSVSIRITPPDLPCGIITKYELDMWEAGSSWRTYSYGPASLTHTFDKLKLNTTYNFKARAFTSHGNGAWTSAIQIAAVENKAVVPDDLFLCITPGKTTDSTITVEVPNMPKSLKTGSISKVRIAVERQETRRKRSTPLLEENQDKLTDHATAKEKGYPGYIAAELGANFSGPFVIGDGKMYGGYDNPPLTKGHTYVVIFGMVLAVGGVTTIVYRRYGQPITVEAAGSNHKVGLGVGLAGGVLVVLAVAIVVMIMWRKRREKRETAESIDTQLHSITRPTTVPEVEQVERKVSDNKTDRHTHPTGEDAAKATATLQTPDNAHDSVYMNVDNRAFENAEESAYIEVENPYEELNITPDVIADQVYAKISADC